MSSKENTIIPWVWHQPAADSNYSKAHGNMILCVDVINGRIYERLEGANNWIQWPKCQPNGIIKCSVWDGKFEFGVLHIFSDVNGLVRDIIVAYDDDSTFNSAPRNQSTMLSLGSSTAMQNWTIRIAGLIQGPSVAQRRGNSLVVPEWKVRSDYLSDGVVWGKLSELGSDELPSASASVAASSSSSSSSSLPPTPSSKPTTPRKSKPAEAGTMEIEDIHEDAEASPTKKMWTDVKFSDVPLEAPPGMTIPKDEEERAKFVATHYNVIPKRDGKISLQLKTFHKARKLQATPVDSKEQPINESDKKEDKPKKDTSGKQSPSFLQGYQLDKRGNIIKPKPKRTSTDKRKKSPNVDDDNPPAKKKARVTRSSQPVAEKK